MEEIHRPTVDDMVYIGDNAFTNEAFLQAEASVLQALGFDIVLPTVVDFLPLFYALVSTDADNMSKPTSSEEYNDTKRDLQWPTTRELLRSLANYLGDLAIQSPLPLQFCPSVIAWSCIYLSILTIYKTRGCESKVSHDPPTPFEVCANQDCTDALYQVWLDAPNRPTQAIRTKYLHVLHHKVAKIDPQTQCPFRPTS